MHLNLLLAALIGAFSALPLQADQPTRVSPKPDASKARVVEAKTNPAPAELKLAPQAETEAAKLNSEDLKKKTPDNLISKEPAKPPKGMNEN